MSTNLTSRQAFSPSCPRGGTWWACGYGTFFVGCCARDPCEITCAQGNLSPGAFDPAAYGTFPDATCGTGSKFYTCTSPIFWGCCKTNACSQGGCPDGDLEPAIINRPDLLSAYHATGGSTTVSSATPTSSATGSTSSSDPTINVAAAPSPTVTHESTTTSPSATASAQAEQKTPVAAIAGGAAGGAFAVALVVGLVIWFICFRRKKGKHDENGNGTDGRQDILPIGIMTENQHSQRHQIHIRTKPADAPPSYTSPNPGFENTFYSQQSPPNQYTQSPYHSQDPHDPRYVAYAHHDPNYASTAHTSHEHPPNWPIPPQELPISSPSRLPPTPAQFRAHKSMYGHARGPSELSGDELRSELESGREMDPESPVLGAMWKSQQQSSIDGHVTGSSTPQSMWMAPQDWGSRGDKTTVFNPPVSVERRGEAEGRSGLGLQGLGVLSDASEGSDGMDAQRAERRFVRGANPNEHNQSV